MRSSRKILLAGSSLLGIAVSLAQPQIALADGSITTATSTYNWDSGNLSVSNGVLVSGTTDVTAALAVGSSASVGTLTNNGTISGAVNASGSTGYGPGIGIAGKVGALTNNGTISGCSACAGISISGGLGVLTNNGNIAGGIYNVGSIGSMVNSGSINGAGSAGVNNAGGTIGALVNNGVITSGSVNGTLVGIGINNVASGSGNAGVIGTLVNGGSINGFYGVVNGGSIGSLTNTGTVSGTAYAIVNNSAGSIASLSNGGVVSGVNDGLANQGNISSLTNSGTITGSGAGGIGIANKGAIGVLANLSGGTISGANDAITNSGVAFSTIGNSTITSGNNGAIGLIANSGVIAGNVENTSANALTIAGGSGSTYGTLTGYSAGSAGTITSTAANLVFSSGNLLLNDDINVGSHSVVNNGATLKLTNARTVTGNYLQTGGALAINVASASNYGSLTVSGSANVAKTGITLTGTGLAAGETFTVVQAGSGNYSNDYASVRGVSGISATLNTVNNNLVVVLTPGGYSSFAGGSGAGSGIGAALDAINASNTPAAIAFQNNVLAPLDALPVWQKPAAIRQLAPIQIAPAAQVANLAVTPTTSAIETHQLAMGESNASGAAAGSAPHAYGLWGQVQGGVAQRNSDATTDGYQSSNFGLVSGLDFHVDPDTTVGAAFSWMRGWSWGEQGETGSFVASDSYQLTAYGQHYWGQFFVDGQVGVGYDTFRQRRNIGYLGVTGNNMAYANFDGQHYLAKLGGGYDIPMSGGVTLTPLAGLQGLRAVSAGYTETSAAENLAVKRRGVQSLTQDIGGKVSWSSSTDWGTLTPELRLAWVHDYIQGQLNTAATVVGGLGGGSLGASTSFPSLTARPASDGARVNVAATLDTVGDMSLRAEYEGEARQNYQSHTGMLKATWNF
jgi:uncharacterized protein with beta-barrel porin domain